MPKKNTFYDQNHPVALAVEPLRVDAVERARQQAQSVVDRVAEKLKEHGGDREAFAAYPPYELRKTNRFEYDAQAHYHTLVHGLTMSDPEKPHVYCRPHDPDPAIMDVEGVRRYIKRAMDAADAQYTSFVCKLVGKIGQCDSAEIDGSHVWGHSILTVKKGEAVERWKTQQIVNMSSLGNYFNQWPSRKLKK